MAGQAVVGRSIGDCAVELPRCVGPLERPGAGPIVLACMREPERHQPP